MLSLYSRTKNTVIVTCKAATNKLFGQGIRRTICSAPGNALGSRQLRRPPPQSRARDRQRPSKHNAPTVLGRGHNKTNGMHMAAIRKIHMVMSHNPHMGCRVQNHMDTIWAYHMDAMCLPIWALYGCYLTMLLGLERH